MKERQEGRKDEKGMTGRKEGREGRNQGRKEAQDRAGRKDRQER